MRRVDTRADPLLEREAELAELTGALNRAGEGEGSLVMVEGFAGTGKTRLLECAVEEARDRDMQVLIARGAEVEAAFPFGAVLQLLARRVRDASGDERAQLLAGAAELATPLLERGGAPPGPEAAFSYQHGLYWLVANLAELRPVLVAVDDAHWADVPSLQFLLRLAHGLDELPVAAVVARRLGEEGDAEPWLDRLGESAATICALGPLSGAAVAAVVRHAYDSDAEEEFCGACADAAGGNPLYLRELLGALREREIPATGHSARYIDRIDPAGLRRSIGTRLERVGEHAMMLAEAASVVEQGLPLRLVARLADVEHDEATDAAHALAQAEILTSDDPLRFVHPVVRNAVYARVTGHRRAAMHRRAAELLRDEQAEPERIAAHIERADAREEEWAVDALQAAAASARERGAHPTAARWLRRALDEGGAAELRPVLTVQIGLARAAAGDLTALEDVRESAVAITDPSERSRYLIEANQFAFYTGHYSDAAALVRRALASLDDGKHEPLADAMAAALVGLVAVTDETAEGEEARVMARADQILASGGSPSTPAERLVLAAVASLGFWRAAIPAARVQQLSRATLAGLPGDEIRGPMYQPTVVLYATDDYETADAALNLAVDAARRRGFQHLFTVASFTRAGGRYFAGRLAEATADAEAAMQGVRQGIVGFEPAIRGQLARCLLDRGDLDGAAQLLELEDLERWGAFAPFSFLHEARGLLALAVGRAEEARDAFMAAGALLERIGAHNPAVCAWRSGAALAEHGLGNAEAAQRLVSDELERARAFGAKRAIGVALRAQGIVLGGDEGGAALDEAVTVLDEAGARLEHARALLDRGALKRRGGRPRDARGDLKEALDRAIACDAAGLAERAREELLTAGGRPRRERVSGPAALTPQERRVATMASEGLSNPEIAQALFLTRKTIEAHMRGIFMKLDISSRGELPAALAGD